MSDTVGVTDFNEGRLFRLPVPLLTEQRRPHVSFTLRDREDLDGWFVDGRRLSFCHSETGPFAMLYEAGRACASWGVVRQGRSVLLWDCVTLADIGRFANMTEALLALPVARSGTPVANVLRFAVAVLPTDD